MLSCLFRWRTCSVGAVAAVGTDSNRCDGRVCCAVILTGFNRFVLLVFLPVWLKGEFFLTVFFWPYHDFHNALRRGNVNAHHAMPSCCLHALLRRCHVETCTPCRCRLEKYYRLASEDLVLCLNRVLCHVMLPFSITVRSSPLPRTRAEELARQVRCRLCPVEGRVKLAHVQFVNRVGF